MKHFVSLTVIAFVIVGAYTRILRLGCLQYADFTYVLEGKVLLGSIIATFLNLSPKECEQECIDNHDCKSINTENAGSKTCQLNSKSLSDASDGVSWTVMPGWTFKSTLFNDRKVGKTCKALSPCQEDELCVDTCNCPGYECILCEGIEQSLPCIFPGNWALGRNTRQSSTAHGGNSERAVDGNRDPKWEHRSCTHTHKQDYPWWRVDLGKLITVHRVRIVNRDRAHEVLHDFNIKVGTEDIQHRNTKCREKAKHHKTGMLSFRCTVPIKGRYVFIESRRKQIHLTVCEVEVTGTFP